MTSSQLRQARGPVIAQEGNGQTQRRRIAVAAGLFCSLSSLNGLDSAASRNHAMSLSI